MTEVEAKIPAEPIPAAVLIEAMESYVENAIASGSPARVFEAMTRMLDVAGLCVRSLADKLPAAE